MASETHTSTEYIKHHLQNLTFGELPDGSLGLAQTPEQAKAMGFWAINVDTIAVSFSTWCDISIPLCQNSKKCNLECASWRTEFCRNDH